jgi:hypothetical protein
MRWHVQGMWSGRRNLRVAAGCRDAKFGKLRRVVGVNQVMRNAWMIRFGGELFLQDRCGFFPMLQRLSG